MKTIFISILIIAGSATFAIAQTKKTYKPKPADDTMFLPVKPYDPDVPVPQQEQYALDTWIATIKAHFIENPSSPEPPDDQASAAKNPALPETETAVNNTDRQPR